MAAQASARRARSAIGARGPSVLLAYHGTGDHPEGSATYNPLDAVMRRRRLKEVAGKTASVTKDAFERAQRWRFNAIGDAHQAAVLR